MRGVNTYVLLIFFKKKQQHDKTNKNGYLLLKEGHREGTGIEMSFLNPILSFLKPYKFFA